jgi:hypothetical protein
MQKFNKPILSVIDWECVRFDVFELKYFDNRKNLIAEIKIGVCLNK